MLRESGNEARAGEGLSFAAHSVVWPSHSLPAMRFADEANLNASTSHGLLHTQLAQDRPAAGLVQGLGSQHGDIAARNLAIENPL